jgi:hypothetical protein
MTVDNLTSSVLIEMGYAQDGQDLDLYQDALVEVQSLTPAISWAVEEAELAKHRRETLQIQKMEKGADRAIWYGLGMLAAGIPAVLVAPAVGLAVGTAGTAGAVTALIGMCCLPKAKAYITIPE